MMEPDHIVLGKTIAQWQEEFPVIKDICDLKETSWINPHKLPLTEAAASYPLALADIYDALTALRPILRLHFPRHRPWTEF